MTLIDGRKRRPILEITDLIRKENARIEVEGVEQIRVRESAGAWRTYQVHGRTNLLEACDLQGRPGEYEVELDGHQISVLLGLAHFSPGQVEEMVAALHEQEYRHDAQVQGGQTARLFTALQGDVEDFLNAWQALYEMVQAIVAKPAERLTLEVHEVSLQRRQRHTPATIALNLRTGRLTSGGEATNEKLFALSDRVSLDTAENSHLVFVVEAYEARRALLLERTSRQIRSLELQLEREKAYRSPLGQWVHLVELIRVVQRLVQALHNLSEQPLPATWRHFRYKPSTSTNRVRFDERYSRVVELEERLHAHRGHGRPDNALELLQECGRRATWELYEYWLVAKLCEQLAGSDEEPGLGFQCDTPEGFRALEDWRGAGYGLKERGSLTFRHPSGLGIQLTYEQHVTWTERGQACILRPDVILNFLDLPGTSLPLVLDAKYKAYTIHHASLDRDLEKSARRYGRALGGAMAFLVHPGSQSQPPFEAWPSPSRNIEQTPLKLPFKEQDLPLKHGVVCVFPGSSGGTCEDVRPLRRILTAWLIRNGIFWVCFKCGCDLKKVKTARANRLPGETDLDVGIRHFRYTTGDKWPKFASYACPCGGLTGMLTFCGNCGKGTDRTWQPIFKYVPREVEGDVGQAEASSDWSRALEVHAVRKEPGKRHLRHCSRCGA